MKHKESSNSAPKKPWFKTLKVWVFLASMFWSCVTLFKWVCGRDDKITANEYARIHHLDPRAVIAAAVEGRIVPPAYWERGPEMAESFAETGKTVLVYRSAVIHPRKTP